MKERDGGGLGGSTSCAQLHLRDATRLGLDGAPTHPLTSVAVLSITAHGCVYIIERNGVRT
jgi:hypothetical protein